MIPSLKNIEEFYLEHELAYDYIWPIRQKLEELGLRKLQDSEISIRYSKR